MAIALYLSHPQVIVDPAISIPDWHISALGRERTKSFAHVARLAGIGRIISSHERKAIETAEILADALSLEAEARDGLQENDRSSTGFLPPPEFEAMADRFFAEPLVSVKGWERAIDAQARIFDAVRTVLAERPAIDVTLLVGHGGVGTLLMSRIAGWPIDRRHDQPGAGGGNWFAFQIAEPNSWRLLRAWQPMESDLSSAFDR